MFRHPKYYKELRKRNKEEARAQLKVPSSNLDQAISHANSTRGPSDVRPDPGHKLPDSTMVKQRASSSTSRDQEQQASSTKRQAFEPTRSIAKRQASQPEYQASSFKPEVTSSLIREPWYMDIGEVLGGKGPRAFASMNVLCGCLIWKPI